MQQAGREKAKKSYSFWVHSQGFDVLPEQITAAAEHIAPFSKQFIACEPGQ